MVHKIFVAAHFTEKKNQDAGFGIVIIVDNQRHERIVPIPMDNKFTIHHKALLFALQMIPEEYHNDEIEVQTTSNATLKTLNQNHEREISLIAKDLQIFYKKFTNIKIRLSPKKRNKNMKRAIELSKRYYDIRIKENIII